MEKRGYGKITVSGVLKEAMSTVFHHFGACLKGIFTLGVLLLASLLLWAGITGFFFREKLLHIIGQAQYCDSFECFRSLIVSDLSSAASVAIPIVMLVGVVIFLLWLLQGLVRYFLHVYDFGTASIKEMFLSLHTAAKAMGAFILTFCIILGGLVLLIVPGIYWGLRFSQAICFVIDKNIGVIDSLKQSWAVTNGYCWQLFFIGCTFGAVQGFLRGFFSALLFRVSPILSMGLGISFFLITFSMQYILLSCIYRRLTSNTQ